MPAHPPRHRNSRPSSPNRSRCRPGGRTPAWRISRRWFPCCWRFSSREIPARRLPARFQRPRHAGLAEILLRQHVAGHLAPAFGNFDVGLGEDDGAVGIADLAGGVAEGDAGIGRLTFDREMTADAHDDDPGKGVENGPSRQMWWSYGWLDRIMVIGLVWGRKAGYQIWCGRPGQKAASQADSESGRRNIFRRPFLTASPEPGGSLGITGCGGVLRHWRKASRRPIVPRESRPGRPCPLSR